MPRNDKNRVINAAKAQAAIDRAEYFKSPGATPMGWRGGPATVTINRKRQASRKACRHQG